MKEIFMFFGYCALTSLSIWIMCVLVEEIYEFFMDIKRGDRDDD